MDMEVDNELPSMERDKSLKSVAQSAPDLTFADVTVEEVLGDKLKGKTNKTVENVNEDDTVFSAIGLMDKKGIGAVLVTNAKGEYTGIFTERDYMRKIALKGLSSRETPVKRVMTANPLFLGPKDTATRCMRIMTEKRLRHLPVRDEESGAVIGVVSIGDVLKTVITQFKETTIHYQNFISGKYPDAHS